MFFSLNAIYSNSLSGNLAITCCSELSQKVQEQCPISKWFPSEGSSRAKNVAIGIIVGLGAFLAVSAIVYVLETNCSWFSVSQDAIQIFSIFKNVHPFLDLAWKGLFRGVVVLAGPVLEELLFRGYLNDKIEQCQGEEQTTLKKVIRIALVSILFGACHLSPFQNTISNVVIFCTTTALGFVFVMLKEKRKDLIAPIAAHIIYNLALTI